MALPPFCARRYALHRVMAAPRSKGLFFVHSPIPVSAQYRRKDFPPYLTRQASLLSGSILGPVWGLFRYPPLRCRGKALAGSRGRYVLSVDNCAGMRLPVQAGERFQLVSINAASPGPKAVPPAGGRWRFAMSKSLSVFGGVFPSRHSVLTHSGPPDNPCQTE